jgi:hypothetical protein
MSKRPDINFIPVQEVAPPGGYLKVSRIRAQVVGIIQTLSGFLPLIHLDFNPLVCCNLTLLRPSSFALTDSSGIDS